MFTKEDLSVIGELIDLCKTKGVQKFESHHFAFTLTGAPKETGDVKLPTPISEMPTDEEMLFYSAGGAVAGEAVAS